MNPIPFLSRITAAAALTVMATASHAALTTYTSSAALISDSTAAATDSFDDLALDILGSPATRSVGGYGYAVTSPGGLFGAGTAADAWLGTNDSVDSLTLSSFTGGVRAVGALVFGTDAVGDFQPGQSFTVTATDSLGAVFSSTITGATTLSFVGFLSSGFITSMTIRNDGGDSFATINNLVLASAPTTAPPIPEPASVAMLVAGLGVLAFIRRRRNA